MTEKEENKKAFSTCMENGHFAEMMQKMMGRQGVGSLCAEMMEKVMERQEDGCSFDCAEMMRKMMKERSKVQEDSQKSKEEVCHGRKES